MTTAAEKQADEAIRNAMEMAERKVGLAEMIKSVDLEAHRIEGSERARLLAGLIDEPGWEQVERIMLLLAVMKFLQQCSEKPDKAIEWLRRRRDAAS
ncbi:hypothetical protein [Bradyrhizobium japonicum]|uniref:hypothetical protein n=1 Tax=Bradyrhizobium japonicum TaxID=375 RepID=UPI0003F917F4|nr:hypothetical protein [Bradyrhizobium japonicum]